MGTTPFGFESNRERSWAVIDGDRRILTTSRLNDQYNNAFGEVRVSRYEPLSAWSFAYNLNSELIIPESANGGTATASESFAVLQTGANAAGSASIRTRKAMRYQPGLGGLVRFTAIFSPGVADSLQEEGYGDETDGFFFGYYGSEFGVNRRNNGVDNFTPLADFSHGAFEGFDPHLLNVYEIKFQWLGGGEIKFGIENPETGVFQTVHQIKYANTSTAVTIRNPNLPIVARVVNSGNATNLTLRTPSATAGLEGAVRNQSLQITRVVNGAIIGVGTAFEPVVTLRNPATYQGLTNRLTLYAVILSVATAGNGSDLAEFAIIKDATLTGATFTAVDADATPGEIDTAATAMTGGIVQYGVDLGTIDSKTLDITRADITVRPGEQLTVAALGTGAPDVAAYLTFISEV